MFSKKKKISVRNVRGFVFHFYTTPVMLTSPEYTLIILIFKPHNSIGDCITRNFNRVSYFTFFASIFKAI
jgi:hypothetical protein